MFSLKQDIQLLLGNLQEMLSKVRDIVDCKLFMNMGER